MRYGKSMSEALAEVREGFSKKEIKMARYWSCFQWRAGAKVDN